MFTINVFDNMFEVGMSTYIKDLTTKIHKIFFIEELIERLFPKNTQRACTDHKLSDFFYRQKIK